MKRRSARAAPNDRSLTSAPNKLPGNLSGAVGAGLAIVAFCLVLLWHDPLLFWNDDYELSILPVFADVARSWSEGHLPLLSPYSWVCGNLAGEFQYGTFSIFVNAAVVIIWRLPLAFAQQAAALSIVHLFVLAMGCYMLARDRDLSPPLGLLVALVGALNGWIICWGASDWFGALGAFTWVPWAWWGMERALDSRRGRWRLAWPAPFVYLLIAGGFPYTVVMLALLIVWLAMRTIVETRRISDVWPLVIGVLLGVGIAAPAWLALFDYVRGSAREAQDPAAHLQWRVPLSALPAFIWPNWTVRWADFSTRLMPHSATEFACGFVPPLALIAGLVTSPRLLLKRIRWELILLGVVVVLAMIPTAGVFRWSFRWLPLAHLALALCAAEALQREDKRRAFSAIVLGLIFVSVIAMLLVARGPFAFPLTWITLAIGASWLAAERFGVPWAAAVASFAILISTYLCIPPNCGVPKYNLAQELTDPAPLDPHRLYLSVYPFPEYEYRIEKHPDPVGQLTRPGSTSMFAGLRFINGYSPIRPAGVARAYNPGIHGQIDFPTASRLLQEQAGPSGELAQLGIDGVIVASGFALRPLPESEWQVASSSQEGTVYHRAGAALGLVQWMAASAGNSFTPPAVDVIENSRNRIVLQMETTPTDSLLVLSRPFFPGYVATLNGARTPVATFRGLAPAVRLPAGSSGKLELIYRPRWLVGGGIIALFCAVLTAMLALFGWGERRA
ncbi:MAG: hypothetical protein ACJ8KU_07650 [Chthoniobacterales bacterium]